MKFSVIIAEYNCQYTIKNALNSFVKQDYKEYEVRVVNEKSTDETLSVIDSYIEVLDNRKFKSSKYLGKRDL